MSAGWKRANPEKVRAQKRRYEAGENGKATARRRYARRREQLKAASAAFSRSHPELARAKQHRRKAAKAGAEGFYRPEHLKILLWLQYGRCFYCPADLVVGFHVDHIVPLAKGGSNWVGNLVLACASCNTSKQACDALTWALRRTMDRQ